MKYKDFVHILSEARMKKYKSTMRGGLCNQYFGIRI